MLDKENFRSDEEVRKEIQTIRQELRKAQDELWASNNLQKVCNKLDAAIQTIRDLRAKHAQEKKSNQQ